MNNTLKRTLILLVASTAFVALALATGLGPQTGGEPSHDMHAAHTVAVDSEEAFIAHMIPHHQEAVESAQAVLATTERPEVRELAQNVIATQTEEIVLLQGWLEAWYPDATAAVYEPMMPDPRGLSPDEADRAFLEGMIVHHGGAIEMAQAYLDGDFEKRGEVVALAERIIAAQRAEITQMQGWLTAWYGGE
ncbi:DUF305 domain-containing protein [Truepera radiovictrix]|uniref:DUF305 domain-containing protein n=1 Tax=Truepera radiovictrix (strain DSM 17093 / CIP 108686 / LMG 22925 / RQ-24) TaxID=649638 RepID=D7CRB0_TRURR|nr:DUF305 domain-containing protein [Truepera radiovictrix]ADI15198.1 protein of unknown function DUF305 [Truepera radiovictrix DSM 17093]WMT56251.1 DUF305 domain-containing protein [Truepera radiovictrix]